MLHILESRACFELYLHTKFNQRHWTFQGVGWGVGTSHNGIGCTGCEIVGNRINVVINGGKDTGYRELSRFPRMVYIITKVAYLPGLEVHPQMIIDLLHYRTLVQ